MTQGRAPPTICAACCISCQSAPEHTPGGGGLAKFTTSASTRPAGAGGGSSTSAEATLPADRRDSRVQEIRTSLHMPVGQMVLVGGMTVDPTPPPAGNPGKPPPQLYLFLEVTAD